MPELESDKLSFKAELKEKAQAVNECLAQLLAEQEQMPEPLKAAVEYTLNAPGKRIRAALVMWSCEVVYGEIHSAAQIAAAAIEMVHTYSLIHDDLPAMDDDDLRRGQPSCHKAFDEATAILTGDALLTLAFEVMATRVGDSQLACKMIETLARAAGPAGMVAGQVADLESENGKYDLEKLQYIHTHKTARMFSAAAALGALAARANQEQLEAMREFGLKIGLGFQISDDILDVSSTKEHLGKTVGKDAAAGKATYPGLLGMEQSRAMAEQLAEQAVAHLELFGERAVILRVLTQALLDRTK